MLTAAHMVTGPAIILIALYRLAAAVTTAYEVFQLLITLLALAAVTLALGVTSWLVRERDERNAVSKRMGT